MAPQMTKGLTARGSVEKPEQKFIIGEDGFTQHICNRCAEGKHLYSKCHTLEWEWAGHSDADAEELEEDHCNRYAKKLFHKKTRADVKTYRKGTIPSSTASLQATPSSNAGSVHNLRTQTPVVHGESHIASGPSVDFSTVKAAVSSSQVSTTQSTPPDASGQPVNTGTAKVSSSSAGTAGTATHPEPATGVHVSQQPAGRAPEDNERSKTVESVARYPNYANLTDATYADRKNPGDGGTSLGIRTNFLEIGQLPAALYRYSISYGLLRDREVKNKTVKINLISELFRQPPFASVRAQLATDWKNLLISTKRLYNQQIETGQIEQIYLVNFTNQSQTAPNQLHEVKVKPLPNLQPAQFHNYVNRVHNTDSSEVITALNIISQRALADPNSQYVRAGRGRYFEKLDAMAENTKTRGWSHGLHPRDGFVYSVRPGDQRKLLNLNVAATVFHNRMHLTTLIERFFNVNLARGLNANQTKDLRALICGLRARLTYTPPNQTANPCARGTRIQTDALIATNGRSKRMNGLGASVATQTFTHGVWGQLSVQKYFNDHVLPQDQGLQYPLLPAVNVGGTQTDSKVWIPSELLWIEPHQPLRGKLPPSLVKLMITFARKRPNDNADEITGKGVHILGNNFGLGIRDRPAGPRDRDCLVRLQGRFLQAPQLQYLGSTAFDNQSKGQWNLAGKKFLDQRTLRMLHVIGVGPLDEHVLGTNCEILARGLAPYGIGVGANPTVKVTMVRSTEIENLDRGLQQLRIKSSLPTNTNPVLIFVVIRRRDTLDYANIKRWGDAIVGIPTIVITEGKLLTSCGRDIKPDLGFQANIALKVNTKLRGRNHSLPVPDYKRLKTGNSSTTMVVGADVTHPGVGSLQHCPSIAAVVASIDECHTIYPGSVRLQLSKQEIISDLDAMIAERLRCWRDNNKKEQLPKSILIYRDGVSESQFALVKTHELPKIEEGCASVGTELGMPDYKPAITLVTVTKRHQTRFYPTGRDPEKGFGSNNGNFKPGLVVDTVVKSPYHFDFYLQSHHPRQGTARNGHYFVLENGMNLTADELQGLTFKFCWLYARSVTAVSYVTPAYYADKLCDRARCFLLDMLTNRYEAVITENNEAGVLRQAREDPNVWRLRPGRENPWHENLDEMMFYL